MQGERVTDPVRSHRRGRDLFDDHLDPVRAIRIDDEDNAIERKQGVEARIRFWLRHRQLKLSPDDNPCKKIPRLRLVDLSASQQLPGVESNRAGNVRNRPIRGSGSRGPNVWLAPAARASGLRGFEGLDTVAEARELFVDLGLEMG